MEISMEIYLEFARWLDNMLETNNMPDNTRAFCFNLYEEEDETYGIQLVASNEFDSNDDEGSWACSEVWTSGEDIFYIDHSDESDAGLERGQEFIGGLIRTYLEQGVHRNILLDSEAVGAGFVDGDLEIIYLKS